MSRCCIVPPTMLDRIARHGTKAQRGWALSTIALDATIRQARVQNQLLRGVRGHREGPDALAALENQGANREIRDAQGAEQVMRGPIVRTEGGPPTGDAAADEAYDGLGATYDFWEQAYGRNSIDDEGMPLRGVVHYGQDYDNAFWDGRRMVFGDGDGKLFLRFTRSLDVIGHELAHGVTEDENGLQYQGQSGALNESCSDVFGSLVKQHALGQTADQADWLIGADLLGPDVQGDGAALDGGAGHRLRRRRPRQGPAARRTWTTSSSRARTTAACTSTPGSPTTRSTSWRRRSAATPGSAPGGSGTRRRATAACAARRRSRTSRASPWRSPGSCSAPAAPMQDAVRGGWDAVGVAWT